MRLDKHDIFPLSIIILTFAIAIPIALWVGFGSRAQQIVRDLYDVAKYFAFVGICASHLSLRGLLYAYVQT